MKWLKHVGARRGTAGWLCRKPESTGWWLERTLGRGKPALHAPEIPVPPPTIGFRININGLIQGPEVKLSPVVGKEM